MDPPKRRAAGGGSRASRANSNRSSRTAAKLPHEPSEGNLAVSTYASTSTFSACVSARPPCRGQGTFAPLSSEPTGLVRLAQCPLTEKENSHEHDDNEAQTNAAARSPTALTRVGWGPSPASAKQTWWDITLSYYGPDRQASYVQSNSFTSTPLHCMWEHIARDKYPPASSQSYPSQTRGFYSSMFRYSTRRSTTQSSESTCNRLFCLHCSRLQHSGKVPRKRGPE